MGCGGSKAVPATGAENDAPRSLHLSEKEEEDAEQQGAHAQVMAKEKDHGQGKGRRTGSSRAGAEQARATSGGPAAARWSGQTGDGSARLIRRTSSRLAAAVRQVASDLTSPRSARRKGSDQTNDARDLSRGSSGRGSRRSARESSGHSTGSRDTAQRLGTDADAAERDQKNFLLIVGTANAGKSVLRQQCGRLYGLNYECSIREAIRWVPVIRDCCLRGAQSVCTHLREEEEAARVTGINLATLYSKQMRADMAAIEAVDTRSATIGGGGWTEEVKLALQRFVEHPAVREVLEHKCWGLDEGDVIARLGHFRDRIAEVGSQTYVPSENDLLWPYLRTSGMVETSIYHPSIPEEVVIRDMSGRRNEHRRWTVATLDTARAIFFLVAANSYDKDVFGDPLGVIAKRRARSRAGGSNSVLSLSDFDRPEGGQKTLLDEALRVFDHMCGCMERLPWTHLPRRRVLSNAHDDEDARFPRPSDDHILELSTAENDRDTVTLTTVDAEAQGVITGREPSMPESDAVASALFGTAEVEEGLLSRSARELRSESSACVHTAADEPRLHAETANGGLGGFGRLAVRVDTDPSTGEHHGGSSPLSAQLQDTTSLGSAAAGCTPNTALARERADTRRTETTPPPVGKSLLSTQSTNGNYIAGGETSAKDSTVATMGSDGSGEADVTTRTHGGTASFQFLSEVSTEGGNGRCGADWEEQKEQADAYPASDSQHPPISADYPSSTHSRFAVAGSSKPQGSDGRGDGAMKPPSPRHAAIVHRHAPPVILVFTKVDVLETKLRGGYGVYPRWSIGGSSAAASSRPASSNATRTAVSTGGEGERRTRGSEQPHVEGEQALEGESGQGETPTPTSIGGDACAEDAATGTCRSTDSERPSSAPVTSQHSFSSLHRNYQGDPFDANRVLTFMGDKFQSIADAHQIKMYRTTLNTLNEDEVRLMFDEYAPLIPVNSWNDSALRNEQAQHRPGSAPDATEAANGANRARRAMRRPTAVPVHRS